MTEKRKFQTVSTSDYTKLIASDIESPIVYVINSKLKTAQMYGTSVRYMIIIACDPVHLGFLNALEDYRLKEGAEIFLKEETPDNEMSRVTFPLSSKVLPELFLEDGTQLEMARDLDKETPIKVTFDIVRYTDKNSGKIKFTFPMKKVVIHV